MRDEALTYIKEQNNPLVAICSPYENSPYAVFEIMNLGIPLICSRGGGAIELFKDSSYKGLIEMNHTSLADCVVDYIENRFDPPESLKTPSEIATEWIGYHIDIKSELEEFYCGLQETGTTPIPLVTVVIPTYNRPDKIYDAVLSILAQTYPRIELIIVDDGSNNYDAIDALREIEPIVKYSGGHVIYRENGYLGAARNTGLRQAKGEYICFLDDDDIALDCMISDLVKAIHLTKSDVVVAVNAYMELAMREKTITAPVSDQKPSYIPVGGAYGLAAIENCIGGATSIISTKVMKEIGGYSETYGVGHEDYELYTKLLSSGYKIEVCPKVHYYYEVGRPSMLSTTSISENFHRNFSAYSVDERSREMINMCIGQRIEQDKAGRISWIYRDRPQAEIRKFFQVWHSRIDGIKAFLELMRAEGKEKSSFYRALSEDIGDIQ
jgi:glycosyltransferase involved in cell wall biosynthesis